MLSPLPVSPLPVSPPPLSPPPAEMPFVNGLVNPSAARRVVFNDPPNSDDQKCQNDVVLTPKLAFKAAGSLVSSPPLKGR